MKKTLALMLAVVCSLAIVACGSAETTSGATETDTGVQESSTAAEGTAAVENVETPKTVTITTLNQSLEAVEIEVPYNPQRIAILDMASLDILDNLGLGDRVVGSAKTSLDYLQAYAPGDTIANLGTIKEADMEAVMACEPDVIFIGGRLSKSYDALSEIAPVIYLGMDAEAGVVEGTKQNARILASLFGLEEQIEAKLAGFDERIAKLAAFAEGKEAIVGLCTSGSFNVVGNDGRCSIIGKEIGFNNVGVAEEIATSTHGNEASFEYIFVMDRDAAIQTEGAKLAQEIMENELVMGTDAYKNENIIYLAHPAVWYTAEGGVTALDLMLQDLETELLAR